MLAPVRPGMMGLPEGQRCVVLRSVFSAGFRHLPCFCHYKSAAAEFLFEVFCCCWWWWFAFPLRGSELEVLAQPRIDSVPLRVTHWFVFQFSHFKFWRRIQHSSGRRSHAVERKDRIFEFIVCLWAHISRPGWKVTISPDSICEVFTLSTTRWKVLDETR